MPKIIGSAVALTAEEVEAVIKVDKVFDLFFELNRLIKSMSDYVEQFGIDKKPVTADELEDMACVLRTMLDNDACDVISDTVAVAIADVLKERNKD